MCVPASLDKAGYESGGSTGAGNRATGQFWAGLRTAVVGNQRDDVVFYEHQPRMAFTGEALAFGGRMRESVEHRLAVFLGMDLDTEPPLGIERERLWIDPREPLARDHDVTALKLLPARCDALHSVGR